MLRAHRWSTVLVVSGLLWGCSDGSSRAPQTTPALTVPAGTGSASEPDAAKVLRSFATDTRASLTASFGAVQAQIRKSASRLRDAAIPLVGASEPSVRFAAIYALSLTADNAGSRLALGPVLTSASVGERLLAAEALLRGGDTSALPVVIAALASDHSMDLWEPPMPAWRFARLLLLDATDLDFGLRSAKTLDEALAAKAAWEQWWRASGSTYELPAPAPSS